MTKVHLHEQKAHPIEGDGEVAWYALVILDGTYRVLDNVIDNLGGTLFVTLGDGQEEFAIAHEELNSAAVMA